MDNLREVANTKVLCDYATPIIMDTIFKIGRPLVLANNFEIKPVIIQMIHVNQIGGTLVKDPNAHILNLLEIYDTFKYNGIFANAMRLKLFLFLLRGKVKSRLYSLLMESITTWNFLLKIFLVKLCSLTKITKMRNEIVSFT